MASVTVVMNYNAARTFRRRVPGTGVATPELQSLSVTVLYAYSG